MTYDKIDYDIIKAGDWVQVANGDWFKVWVEPNIPKGTPMISVSEHDHFAIDNADIGALITDHRPLTTPPDHCNGASSTKERS